MPPWEPSLGGLTPLHTWGCESKVPHKTWKGQTLSSDSHQGAWDLNDSHYLCFLARQLQTPKAVSFHQHVLFAGDCLFPLIVKNLDFLHWTSELKKPFGWEAKHLLTRLEVWLFPTKHSEIKITRMNDCAPSWRSLEINQIKSQFLISSDDIFVCVPQSTTCCSPPALTFMFSNEIQSCWCW